jgi:hypothetical protein
MPRVGLEPALGRRALHQNGTLVTTLSEQLRLGDVLAAPLPVRAISVRLIRKKQERQRVFHWNPILHPV